MLYVFLVNTGCMVSFDMQLAMSTVDTLKQRIAERCDIAVDKQVLLISGGEWLEGGARVGSYPAGTDTSPIFLFSKQASSTGAGGGTETSACIGADHSPTVVDIDASTSTAVGGDTSDGENDDSMSTRVADALLLRSSLSTVATRSQLAQQLYERGKRLMQLCDRLIREQHLQQQGWAAAVANMDDLTQSLQSGSERFHHVYTQYLLERPRHLQLLETFPSDVQLLARVPLLERLTDGAQDGHASLLDWISAQDSSRLQDVCDKARAGIDRLDDEFVRRLRDEVAALLNPALCASMAEIGGLEGRLMRLDRLRHDAERVLREQMELARAFMYNQERANYVNDPSVLPDLCQSHCTQLQVMLTKHRQLIDARRRCARAKRELSANIGTRLGWVVSVQRSMTELCSRLVIYSERLKQLRQQLAVLAALHAAPRVFCRAAGEVVRRRHFSRGYMAWARGVSATAADAVHAEKRRRKRFAELLGAHFLTAVFPGLDAMPPDFAVECPAEFDARLPPLEPTDLTTLSDAVPEMTDVLHPPTASSQLLAHDSSVSRDQLAALRQQFEQLQQSVSQQLLSAGRQLTERREAIDARVTDAVAACQRLQLTASEASTCAELAEARAEEQAALLAECERRCAEISTELDGERRTATTCAVNVTASEARQTCDAATETDGSESNEVRRVRAECERRLQAEMTAQRERLEAEWSSSLHDQLQQLRLQHEQQLASERAQHRTEALALRARFRSMTAHLSASMSSAGSPGGGTAVVSSSPQTAGDAPTDLESVRRDNRRLREQLSRSTAILVQSGRLNVQGCADGDAVLVVWDAEKRHYRVHQETATLLYFVHADSYASLGLASDQSGVPAYTTAQVVSHEFCQAKKDGNRYRVAHGTRFYRVKLRPWSRTNFP